MTVALENTIAFIGPIFYLITAERFADHEVVSSTSTAGAMQ